MNPVDIEHPEISWYHRTGYSSDNQYKPPTCELCHSNLEDEFQYEDAYHSCLCEHCLLFTHMKV